MSSLNFLFYPQRLQLLTQKEKSSILWEEKHVKTNNAFLYMWIIGKWFINSSNVNIN